MSKTRQLTQGAATFFIYDKKLEHKDDDPFILWLKSEGFKAEYFGHGNADHAIYVNINTKVYTWAMAGVGLSPIVGNHAIHIDEFMQIYEIFKKYSGFHLSIYTEEEQKAYEEREAQSVIGRQCIKKATEEYFAQNPSFEKWCEDVFGEIKADSWYKEHWPDFSKEEFNSFINNNFVRNEMECYFKGQTLPKTVAGNWELITF